MTTMNEVIDPTKGSLDVSRIFEDSSEGLFYQEGVNYTGSPGYAKHPLYLPLPSREAVLVRPLSQNDPRYPVKPGDACLFYSAFLRGLDADYGGGLFPVFFGFQPWDKFPVLGDMVKAIEENLSFDNPLLKLVRTNFNSNSIAWKGRAHLLLNVIDRADLFWNSHLQAKVLVNNVTYDTNNLVKTYECVPQRLWGAFLDNPRVDKIVCRKSEKYWTFSPEENPEVLEEYPCFSPLASSHKVGELTEDEKGYAVYDFQNMPLYAPSELSYVFLRLRNFIRKADYDLPGYHFEEQFRSLIPEDKIPKRGWADLPKRGWEV